MQACTQAMHFTHTHAPPVSAFCHTGVDIMAVNRLQLGRVLKDRADSCLFLSNRERGDVANLDFISVPLSDSDR